MFVVSIPCCSLLRRERAEPLESVVLVLDYLYALRWQNRLHQFLPDNFGVKIAQIRLALHLGYVRRRHLLSKQLVDIEALEPGVKEDIVDVVVLT